MHTQTTYFGLLAEFGTAEIPLKIVAPKFLGISYHRSKLNPRSLPFPVYRCGSQRSEWMVDAIELAKFLDTKKEMARNEWKKFNKLPKPSNRDDGWDQYLNS